MQTTFEKLGVQMKAQEGVTKELKANNQLEWVQRMNSIRNRALEIVCKAFQLCVNNRLIMNMMIVFAA